MSAGRLPGVTDDMLRMMAVTLVNGDERQAEIFSCGEAGTGGEIRDYYNGCAYVQVWVCVPLCYQTASAEEIADVDKRQRRRLERTYRPRVATVWHRPLDDLYTRFKEKA